MIYITGDTHGNFEKLRDFDAKTGDFLIICGDFGGVWDGSETDEKKLAWLGSRPYTTLFVDGNHENFDLLYTYPVKEWNGGKVHVLNDRVLHMMRGQVFTIEGRTFFTMGGGLCHDITGGVFEPDDPELEAKTARLKRDNIPYRVNRVSWWAQELPCDEEYAEADANLARHGGRVDFIITHCAPTPIQDVYSPFPFEKDRLTEYLQSVREKVDFGHWFFGHYHTDGDFDEKFTILFDKIIRLK